MPRVPYSPTSSVSSVSGTVRGPEVRAIPDAFGAGVASANQNLSRTLEATGDEIFKRAMDMQALANDSAAKKADADFVIKMGDMHAEYQSLQGQAAVDARPAYVENLRKLREEVGEGLNPAARRVYDNSTRQQFARAVFNSAGHSASQLRQSAKGAALAQIEANQISVGQDPTDDVGFERGLRQNEQNIRTTLGPLQGMSEPEINLAVQKSNSGMVASRIVGMANNDPFKAQEWLTKHRDTMTPADLEKAEKIVDTRVSTLGAREIDKRVNADLFDKPATGAPEKGLDERVLEAKELAKKLAPDNKLIEDTAVARVRATYAGRKKDAKDTLDFNRLNVASAINGDYGKVPTTVEELRGISPAIAKSYDDLPSTMKPAMLRAMASNAKGDVGETEERYRKYTALRGQALSTNDEERIRFLDMNVAEQDLPRKWRTSLLKMQESLAKGAGGDPRVNRAMRVLTDAGIAPRLANSSADIVNSFRGALSEALDEYQENYKKSPDFDTVKQIGAQIIQEQADPNKWTFGFLNRTTPLYQMSVPADVLDKIKSDPRFKDAGIEPTDEMIQRAYFREQWKKLYGGTAKSQKPQPQPGAGPQVPKSE